MSEQRSAVKKPNFFLVGAPKSGTTAMVQYLASHPEIFMAKKEMHLFGGDLSFRAPFYRHNLKDYLAEFQACDGQRRLGEASVWYLLSAQAASEISAFKPGASIIIMLREPVEMLYSLYYQLRYLGAEHLPSFAEALAAEPDRRAGRRIPRHTGFVQALVYRETARYAEQVQRYMDVFGRERVQVILYDDFAADPARVYRDTLKFLGVEPTCVPTNFKVINGNKSIRCPALRDLRQEPVFHAAQVALRPWLPRKLLLALRALDRFVWQINTRFEQRPPLDLELRAKLQREFAAEVERLSEVLGRDLTHWSK